MAAGLAACLHAPPPISDFAATAMSQAAQTRSARMNAISSKRNIPVPRDFRQLMAAGIRADWPAVSNAYARIWPRSHQYEDTQPDPRITTELWNPPHETYWISYYLAAGWTPELARNYGATLLEDLPENSVVFAGSDASRFVAAPLAENGWRPDLFFISPNALADSLYMDYMEDVYGTKLWIPNPEQRQAAFQRGIEEANARNAPHVRQANSKITIDGVRGIMEINAVLAEDIFRENQSGHRFFLDEGYALLRLYPYLKPHGLLMELCPDPVPSISDEETATDMAYWKMTEDKLFAMPGFAENEVARMTYAIARTAIARLFAYHHMEEPAENAFQQAMRLAPHACNAHFDYVHFMLVPRGEIGKAIEILEQLVEKYPAAREYRESLERLKADRKWRAD